MTTVSRTAGAVAAAAALLVALLAGALAAPHASAAKCKGASTPGYELTGKQARKATLCLINQERARKGLGKLSEHKAQRKAARKHSRTMVKTGCFDHLCPGEKPLDKRLSSSNYLPCVCAWGIAENIAYGYGKESSPRSMVAAWMASSGHRANILNRSFEHLGIGIAKGSPNGGGGAATYTTTFGYRN